MTDTMHQDVVSLTATALSASIHRRELSCEDVLNAYLAQVDATNPGVNALVDLQPREALTAVARERDAQLARGESMGVLHGMPQAPKDLLPAAGMRTTRGSPIFAQQIGTLDAYVFERMRSAGAVFIGRSNSPEFGLGGHTYNSVYGTTTNAWVQGVSAGGSSGGAAVAVAMHMLPVADGSDMMGSLRTPAAFNHLFGMRPSLGCVANGPADESFFQQFTVTGPMARNVPDLALLLSVMAGWDQRAPLSKGGFDFRMPLARDFNGVRIGWLSDLGGALPTDRGLMPLLERALPHFQDIGATVDPVQVDFDLEALWNAWLDLRSFTFGNSNKALHADASTQALLKPEALWEFERCHLLSGADVHRASRVRSAWYRTMLSLFDRYDFLLLPSAQVFPFDACRHWPASVAEQTMDTYHRWLQAAVPATMAGLPSLAVPAGFNTDGLPAGLQIIGRPQHDFMTLQLGHAYDIASGFSRQRTPRSQSSSLVKPS